MNLNRNDILIISELLQASGYMSAKKLGTNCHLSGRQIREQIGQLKTILAKEGYELHSERSKGYILRPVYPNTLEQLEEEVEKQKIDENRKERKLSDRQGDIIVRLVEEGGYLKANQIADEMMISRSTFLNKLEKRKRADPKISTLYPVETKLRTEDRRQRIQHAQDHARHPFWSRTRKRNDLLFAESARFFKNSRTKGDRYHPLTSFGHER